MPPGFLDYARPRLKNASAQDQLRSRRSPWFTITAQAIILLLIAAPIGALTIPVFDHPYGLVGAAVFVVSSVCLLHFFPARSAWWRVLLGAAVVAIATTVALHVFSINTFVIENASGQVIRSINWMPTERNYSFSFHNVPKDAVLRFRVHDLFYNGKGNVAPGGAELADGTQLGSSVWQIGGTQYRRKTKIRVDPGGDVKVTWP